jgi:hypothetical protein
MMVAALARVDRMTLPIGIYMAAVPFVYVKTLNSALRIYRDEQAGVVKGLGHGEALRARERFREAMASYIVFMPVAYAVCWPAMMAIDFGMLAIRGADRFAISLVAMYDRDGR